MLYTLKGLFILDNYHLLENMKVSDSRLDVPLLSRRSSVRDPTLLRRASVRDPSAGAKGEGIFHKIPDLKIPTMKISDEYDIEKTLAEGCFAKIYLTHHRPTNTTVVLKAVHPELTTLKEFVKEYHYSYQLSHHPNILSCYQVAFQMDDYFVFAQEYAPFGDLASNLGPGGLHETFCKTIAVQLSAALGFMHTKSIVHRDLKLENVLVFTPDFSRVKLCDFGATTREGTLVNMSKHTWTTFQPPEMLDLVKNEMTTCHTTSDVWQFGILLFSILTGSPPWESADWVRDPHYSAFVKYQKRKTTKLPDNFRRFTPRIVRAFRKMLDPNVESRAKITEIGKYMKDKWLDVKLKQSKSAGSMLGQQAPPSDQDSICVYLNQREGRHSLDENRARLNRLMSSYGLETTLDQTAVKRRIWDWLSCEETHDDIEAIN